MPDTEQLAPLDAPLAEMARRIREAGLPSFYAGGNGPVCRERARVVRALLYPRPKLAMGKIERTTIPGPAGAMTVEIVRPAEGEPPLSEPIGTLVYYHGGGFIIGDLDSHQMHAVRLANRARVVVMNVDYRLAPEHPFPQGIDDAIAAARWASDHLDRLGGKGKPLAVGGDSSGGNFAAVVALACRDSAIKLAAQFLLYPVTNMTALGDPDIRQGYFAGNHATQGRDRKASPLLADLKGVAPAILGVGRHDFLWDDNVAFAAALRKAEVKLTWREYPTLNHGFFGYTGISKASEAASDQLCDDLAALLK